MSMLEATPGSPLANAYCTVAQATGYLNERLSTQPWYARPEDVTLFAQREAALISATRLLDEQVEWIGTRATSTQALEWPRSGVGLDPQVIPVPVQRATAYYALALLRDTSEATTDNAALVVKRQQLGDTAIEYFDPGTTKGQTPSPLTTIPAEIRQMLRLWGRVLGGVMLALRRT